LVITKRKRREKKKSERTSSKLTIKTGVGEKKRLLGERECIEKCEEEIRAGDEKKTKRK